MRSTIGRGREKFVRSVGGVHFLEQELERVGDGLDAARGSRAHRAQAAP